jgi:hypothetical protein
MPTSSEATYILPHVAYVLLGKCGNVLDCVGSYRADRSTSVRTAAIGAPYASGRRDTTGQHVLYDTQRGLELGARIVADIAMGMRISATRQRSIEAADTRVSNSQLLLRDGRMQEPCQREIYSYQAPSTPISEVGPGGEYLRRLRVV